MRASNYTFYVALRHILERRPGTHPFFAVRKVSNYIMRCFMRYPAANDMTYGLVAFSVDPAPRPSSP